VQILIAHYGKDGHTVLHLAVLHQDGETTKLLLEHQANPNTRDNFKLTPLHIALLRNKAPYQPSIESYNGLRRNKSISDIRSALKPMQYLLNHGADINATGDREASLSQEYLDSKLEHATEGRIFGTPLNEISLQLYIFNEAEAAQTYHGINIRRILINAGAQELSCDHHSGTCQLVIARVGSINRHCNKVSKICQWNTLGY
jgi:hypothetical protein